MSNIRKETKDALNRFLNHYKQDLGTIQPEYEDWQKARAEITKAVGNGEELYLWQGGDKSIFTTSFSDDLLIRVTHHKGQDFTQFYENINKANKEHTRIAKKIRYILEREEMFPEEYNIFDEQIFCDKVCFFLFKRRHSPTMQTVQDFYDLIDNTFTENGKWTGAPFA